MAGSALHPFFSGQGLISIEPGRLAIAASWLTGPLTIRHYGRHW